MYGERNTTTNYLSKLVGLNLDIEELRGSVPSYIGDIQKYLPGNEWMRDLYFSFTYKENLGWKHTRVEAPAVLKQYFTEAEQPVFVTITKNPYSWLLSLHRNPYHHPGSRKVSFENFIESQWMTTRRDNCERWLSNPVELWNIKNRSYLGLAGLDALNLTSENVLDDPAKVIDQISETFGITRKSDDFINYEKSTKDSKKNSNYYRDYYLGEKWRDELSNVAITQINKSLDMDLMQHFGYQVL